MIVIYLLLLPQFTFFRFLINATILFWGLDMESYVASLASLVLCLLGCQLSVVQLGLEQSENTKARKDL